MIYIIRYEGEAPLTRNFIPEEYFQAAENGYVEILRTDGKTVEEYYNRKWNKIKEETEKL